MYEIREPKYHGSIGLAMGLLDPLSTTSMKTLSHINIVSFIPSITGCVMSCLETIFQYFFLCLSILSPMRLVLLIINLFPFILYKNKFVYGLILNLGVL